MSFLGRIANSLADKVKRAAGVVPPYEVVETTAHQFMKMTVIVKEDLLTLYKDQNVFTAVVFAPGSSVAFGLYRVNSESEALQLFNNFSYKLTALLTGSGMRVLSRDWLQQFSDVLRSNPGWTAAHVAAKMSLIDCFRSEFVAASLNVADDVTGVTPLHIAIETENIACIKEMIICGASLDAVDRNGSTVFHYAARTSNEMIVQTLASKSQKAIGRLNAAGESALHEACLADRPQNVEQLLRWGVDPTSTQSYRYPIHCAASVSSIRCISTLCRWSHDQVHLQDKTFGGTPLHWAETKECVYELVQNGANIDARNGGSETALHAMIRRSKFDCVIGLLAKGASAAVKGVGGDSALHMAIETNDSLLVQLLIVFGVDVNGCNDNGETPRHRAATKKDSPNRDYIIHLLHRVGAQRCDRNVSGCSSGCSNGGTFDGKPKTSPVATPDDDQAKLHTAVMAETAMAAALTRSASHTDSPIWTGTDSSSSPIGAAGDRVLCLDGGGIRGMILIQLLRAIEEVAGQPIRNCFDWIGGTSTGAILSLAIVHGKTIQQCLGLYFQLKDAVFSGKRPYSSEPLEAFLKREFGETTRMSERDYPRVMVTGVLADRMPAELHLFKNYDIPGAAEQKPVRQKGPQLQPLPRPNEQHVWRAARSSGAAPTYFRAFGRFLDGGLMSNNPTLDVLTEIHQYNMALRATGQLEASRPIHVVVSLGTGRLPVKAVDVYDVYRPEGVVDIAKVVFGAKNLAELFVDQATQSEGRAVERAAAWCSMIGVPYFRFSPQLSEDVPLDCKDDSTLINMLWETRCYINDHLDRIVQLVSLLQP